MKNVAVYEAKTRLSELLVEVEHGAQFTITRRGLAVARLVSMQSAAHSAAQTSTLPTAQQASTLAADAQRARVSGALAALQGLRQGVTLDLPLADAIGHGRD